MAGAPVLCRVPPNIPAEAPARHIARQPVDSEHTPLSRRRFIPRRDRKNLRAAAGRRARAATTGSCPAPGFAQEIPLVHDQSRLSARGYTQRYETSYLCASAFGRRARGLGGGLAFVVRDAFVLRRCQILLASSRGENAYRIARSRWAATPRRGAHRYKALQRGGRP